MFPETLETSFKTLLEFLSSASVAELDVFDAALQGVERRLTQDFKKLSLAQESFNNNDQLGRLRLSVSCQRVSCHRFGVYIANSPDQT